jgi:hypothetical protein
MRWLARPLRHGSIDLVPRYSHSTHKVLAPACCPPSALGAPLPHLRWDWAHPTFAPGLGSPLPHLHRDWAPPCGMPAQRSSQRTPAQRRTHSHAARTLRTLQLGAQAAGLRTPLPRRTAVRDSPSRPPAPLRAAVSNLVPAVSTIVPAVSNLVPRLPSARSAPRRRRTAVRAAAVALRGGARRVQARVRAEAAGSARAAPSILTGLGRSAHHCAAPERGDPAIY